MTQNIPPIADVNGALNDVKEHLALVSDRQIALLLDIEKQNVAAWRANGEVPANRACQIEMLTEGRITWRDLCPRLVRDTVEIWRAL